MEILSIEETKSSPEVLLDPINHVHLIKGESYPENSTEFYRKIFDWLEEYVTTLDANQEVIFKVELNYFNSSSSKVLMDIFDIFEDACESGKSVVIHWVYDQDNDAILEYGEEFAEDYEYLVFEFIIIE